MKSKLLNLLLIISSLLGYLEWGGDNHSFLFQAEIAILGQVMIAPNSLLHPFIVLPLAAQIILLFTLFQARPNKLLTYIGIAGISILLMFMLVIGLISLNFKIILSTIPFFGVALATIQHHRQS